MRKALLYSLMLLVPAVASAATPSEGVALKVRRGFYTEVDVGTFFTVLGADGGAAADGEAAPAPPVFRNFRFRRIDLSKATDGKPAIIIQGYAEEGHRTRQLTFDDLSLPAQAVIEVDQAEDVTFTNLRTADGAQPTFKETRSVRVTR